MEHLQTDVGVNGPVGNTGVTRGARVRALGPRGLTGWGCGARRARLAATRAARSAWTAMETAAAVKPVARATPTNPSGNRPDRHRATARAALDAGSLGEETTPWDARSNVIDMTPDPRAGDMIGIVAMGGWRSAGWLWASTTPLYHAREGPARVCPLRTRALRPGWILKGFFDYPGSGNPEGIFRFDEDVLALSCLYVDGKWGSEPG